MRLFIVRLGAIILILSGLAARLAAGELSISNASAVPFSISTSDAAPTPGLGQLPTHGMIQDPATNVSEFDNLQKYQMLLDLAHEQRRQKNIEVAQATLSGLMQAPEAPSEIKRQALFELALVAQDDNKLIRAEQIFGQYLQNYSDDPSAPEVLLRQGLLYRQMGVNTLAISKFYAVMSTALKLKLDNMDYYKKIVLQSQIEIADTYYQEGQYTQAADYFNRLLKGTDPELDRGETQFKLVHALSYSTNYDDTVTQANIYLQLYNNPGEVPEVRFFLASALKKLGHNNDSMKQVLLLLQAEQANVKKSPEVWAYWQRRAGDDIASQLYKEGDYFSALQIYLTLSDLDKTPGLQLPVWYQTALVYEQLQDFPKAIAMYDRILDRQKELIEGVSTPTLVSLMEMAKWRKDYLAWMQKAKITQQGFVLTSTNPPPTVTQ